VSGLVTRTTETGSWLARRFQGRGIGTAMRQIIAAFAFDHLDTRHVTSAAFSDNVASASVSRKVGYTETEWTSGPGKGSPSHTSASSYRAATWSAANTR